LKMLSAPRRTPLRTPTVVTTFGFARLCGVTSRAPTPTGSVWWAPRAIFSRLSAWTPTTSAERLSSTCCPADFCPGMSALVTSRGRSAGSLCWRKQEAS
jgi:hypothetical protein